MSAPQTAGRQKVDVAVKEFKINKIENLLNDKTQQEEFMKNFGQANIFKGVFKCVVETCALTLHLVVE
jgi:hypothetical protein